MMLCCFNVLMKIISPRAALLEEVPGFCCSIAKFFFNRLLKIWSLKCSHTGVNTIVEIQLHTTAPTLW